jgi:hypothetical protein
MTLKNRSLLWILAIPIVSVLIFHLLTLTIYPLPWFDETFFASLSKDFYERGKLYPFIAPISYNFQQVYTYGPLYFITQSFFIRLFGFGGFAARFGSFLFALPTSYFFIKIFLWDKKNAEWFTGLLLIAFFFDYTIFENFHMGRMELMALTFVFGYTFFILKNDSSQTKQQYYLNTLLYSLFAAVAVLITPRAGVLLVAPAIIIIYRVIKERRKEQLIALAISIAIFSLMLFIWVQYSFGSFQKMFEFYRVLGQAYDFSRPFSLRDSIFIYQYPVVLLAIILCIVALVVCGKSVFDEINFISLLSLILFYTFVRVHQAYTTYSMPYFYLLIFNSLYKITQANPRRTIRLFANFSVYGLLLTMIFLTLVKAYYILDSGRERNPQAINSFIKQHIPSGSKVIGDDMYYYSVLKSGSDFQYMDWFAEDSVRENYQREIYNYDYIIVSDVCLGFEPKIFNLYKKNVKLELIGRFDPPVSNISNYVNKHRPALISFFTYNGYLYHRIK